MVREGSVRARCHSPARVPVGAAGSSAPVVGSVCPCEPSWVLRMLFHRPASQRISDGLERPDADKNNWCESGAPSALPLGGFGGLCAEHPPRVGAGAGAFTARVTLRCPWDGGRSALPVLPQGTHESAGAAP